MSEKETKKTAAQTGAATQVSAPAPQKTAAAAKHENVMYVGPSIPGVALQNTVYTEIPAGAAEAIKSCPAIGNLFVRVREYSAAEEMLRTKSGHIYAAFERAVKYRLERKEVR